MEREQLANLRKFLNPKLKDTKEYHKRLQQEVDEIKRDSERLREIKRG